MKKVKEKNVDKVKEKIKDLRIRIFKRSLIGIFCTAILIAGMPMYGVLSLGFGALVLNGFILFKAAPLMKELSNTVFQKKFGEKHKDLQHSVHLYHNRYKSANRIISRQNLLTKANDKLENYKAYVQTKNEMVAIFDQVNNMKKPKRNAFQRMIAINFPALPEMKADAQTVNAYNDELKLLKEKSTEIDEAKAAEEKAAAEAKAEAEAKAKTAETMETEEAPKKEKPEMIKPKIDDYCSEGKTL